MVKSFDPVSQLENNFYSILGLGQVFMSKKIGFRVKALFWSDVIQRNRDVVLLKVMFKMSLHSAGI